MNGSISIPPKTGSALALLAVGGVIVCVVALAPLVVGEPLLDQVVVETTVPVLGKVKSGTSILFDLGVAVIVVGLVTAVLDGLGAGQLAAPSTLPPARRVRASAGDGDGSGEVGDR